MFLLALLSCASKGALQEEWGAFVEQHQSCEVDTDCVLVYPGCPLPCVDVISSDAVLDANKTANGLIARYEKFGRNCRYECAAYGTAYCDDGTCAISDERPEEPGPVDLGTGDTGR